MGIVTASSDLVFRVPALAAGNVPVGGDWETAEPRLVGICVPLLQEPLDASALQPFVTC